MKTAIYIEDGVVQLVLSPESKFEKNALSGFTKKPLAVKIFNGSFYDCRGGWVRQKSYYPSCGDTFEDQSIILTVKEEPPGEVEQ